MEVTRQTIISLEKEKYTASLNLAYKLAQYLMQRLRISFSARMNKEYDEIKDQEKKI